MKFHGVRIRFDCIDNKQFEAIGAFWNFMSGLFPREQLRGLGLNWMNDSFDYVIGDFEGRFDYSLPIIRQTYPAAQTVVVPLPDDGWITYAGKTDNIAQIYEDIYRDGVLNYEIEAFDREGNCKIAILRL
jgi:predicted transcriptional regulator YdeE